MIDLHVLLFSANYEWQTACLQSIREAVSFSPFPVKVRVFEGVPGHIGEGRSRAYSVGIQPYVTYVDDDDYLLPDAFANMAEAFTDSPSAVFTSELTLQNGNLSAGLQRHHLAVYRRDQLINHCDYTVCGDMAQLTAVQGTIRDIEAPGYVHRLYISEGRKLRRQHPEEWRAACVEPSA